MLWLRENLAAFQLLLTLLHGQAFFVLGLSIVFLARRTARLEIARGLSSLAVFGFCEAPFIPHGLSSIYQWKNYDSGKGFLIAVGATKGENLFVGLELVAKYFYDALDMSYEGGIFYRQIEDKGAIGERPEALEEAFELGKNAVLQYK